MAVCRCKMCGGELVITEGQEIAYCESCGTKQTLPRISSDQISRMLERANALRMVGDFDKALDIYEKITDEEESNDPEIHWNKVICKYGIQYVEENGKRIPTVNRTQYDSIFDDNDYKECIKNATITTRELYEEEAKTIDNIQKGILEVSSQQEPYDIFISYKETDPVTNQRTQDSEDCYELYHMLTNNGYKVFFSRFSLKQVAGSKYEPHIFAALQSAKVMLLCGSDPSYFEAPWVRNEWSRFFALCKKDPQNKRLIPCYRGIDPSNDLPKELRGIQGIEFGKIGAEANLNSMLEKIIKKQSNVVQNATQSQTANNIASLDIKNARIFIKQGDYENAKKSLDNAYSMDPGNWEIYLCRLLIDYNLTSDEELKDLSATFEDNFNYKQIMQFGDDNVKKVISSYNSFISEQTRLKKDSEIYKDAETLFADASSNDKLNSAKKLYRSIPSYKDSADKEKECIAKIHDNIVNVIDTSQSVSDLNQALNDCDFISEDLDTTEMKEIIGKSIILEKQRAVYNNKLATIPMVNTAISELAQVIDYADAADLRRALEEKRYGIEVAIKRAKRYSAIAAIFAVCVVICIICIGTLTATIALSGPVEEMVSTGLTESGGPEKLVKYRIKGFPQANKEVKYNNMWISTDDKGYLNMSRWLKDGSDYGYYKEDGERARTEFKNIESHDYYFDDAGNIIYKQFANDPNMSKERYVGAEGYVEGNKLIDHGGHKYYLDENGAKRSEGWGQNDDDEFFTQNDGTLLRSNFKENRNNKLVYIKDSGLVAKNDWDKVNGVYYYSKSDGTLEDGGLRDVGGKKYYFNDDHSLVIDEYREVDGKNRYFTDSGMAVNGPYKVKGVLHYFDADGNPGSGWQSVKNENGQVWLYGDSEGKCAVNQALKIGEDIFYFNGDGVMLINTIAGGLYLQGDGKALRNKWGKNEQGNDVYYGENGYKLTNTATPDGYYVGSDGLIVTNRWVDNRFWCDGSGRIARNQWVDNNQYYVGADGGYLSDTTVDGRYLNKSGRYQAKAMDGDFALFDVSIENSDTETRSYTRERTVRKKNKSTGQTESVKETYQDKVTLKFNKVHGIKVMANTNAFDSEAQKLLNSLNGAYSSIRSTAISSCDSDWESFVLKNWRFDDFNDSTIVVAVSAVVGTSNGNKTTTIKVRYNRNANSYSIDSYSIRS